MRIKLCEKHILPWKGRNNKFSEIAILIVEQS